MTLNMFGIITRTRSEYEVDFEMDDYLEFHDWKDRHDLHDWMEDLYYRKGGSLRSFWKANLLLTPRDLDRLERRVRLREARLRLAGLLGVTASAVDIEDDKRFIQRARKAMIMGFNIVYGAWW